MVERLLRLLVLVLAAVVARMAAHCTVSPWGSRSGLCPLRITHREVPTEMGVGGSVTIAPAVWMRALVTRWWNSAATGAFFFNDTAPTEIYTLSLHDALPM